MDFESRDAWIVLSIPRIEHYSNSHNLIRRAILVLTALYFFNSGEFLSPFCFFSGALLADVSLVLRTYTSNTYISLQNSARRSRWQVILKEHWPIALAMFAMFLGTIPPEAQALCGIFSSRLLLLLGTILLPKEA